MPGELIPIVFFLSVAAVAILRPLTTRLGKLFEQQATVRKTVGDPQTKRVMELMERLADRMDRLEERVDFTERILERQGSYSALPGEPTRARRSRDQLPSEVRAGDDESPSPA